MTAVITFTPTFLGSWPHPHPQGQQADVTLSFSDVTFFESLIRLCDFNEFTSIICSHNHTLEYLQGSLVNCTDTGSRPTPYLEGHITVD